MYIYISVSIYIYLCIYITQQRPTHLRMSCLGGPVQTCPTYHSDSDIHVILTAIVTSMSFIHPHSPHAPPPPPKHT